MISNFLTKEWFEAAPPALNHINQEARKEET